MNRKGFTLIELLGVLALLGIILVLAIPSIIDALKTSRLKSEEVFLDKISDTIDSYVTMHDTSLSFSYVDEGSKVDARGRNAVKIYKAETTMESIINAGLITEKDYKDPAFSSACDKSTKVEIYRDDDFVYCHKIKIEDLSCLSDDYLEEHQGETYAIDTCIWETK